MRTARRARRTALALSGVLLISGSVNAEDQPEHELASFWLGGGVGAGLTGDGAPFVNGHKMGMLSYTPPGDHFRLRLLKGSMERTQGIQSGTGDNDIDYQGFDVVITQRATGLPVAFALGAAEYEEAFHVGYPSQDLGGSEFVHRWGPHASVLRGWPLGRFVDLWTEADLHYLPYQHSQVITFLDIGVGLRF
jgi:hypothetical protein